MVVVYRRGVTDLDPQPGHATAAPPADGPAALIVDYGGVLTTPLADTVGAWMRSENVPPEVFAQLMHEWLGDGAAANPAHELETGRLTAAEFEVLLAQRLRGVDSGDGPAADGLLTRMFAGFRAAAGMYDVLRTARRHGLATALLSNSWGNEYDRDGWDDLFDVVVISGEVGLRKPDPAIYTHTARELALDPARCVFVDDLAVNVRGAAAVGMVGVHHTDVATTADELEAIFGLPFRVDPA